MIKVQLQHLQFNSFHGIHEEEKILGNEYIIDASVEFHEDQHVITSIHETVNYADIYKIIKMRMDIPTPLLETILMEIGKEIHERFPHLRSINISIIKMHPPIEGIQGAAAVSYHKEF
ncbi:MAG: dihydroneopterin aldolase [Bacteroidota bacterium]|nr:dihydroneopterin aldolase [Bacteroidota bacterium]